MLPFFVMVVPLFYNAIKVYMIWEWAVIRNPVLFKLRKIRDTDSV